MTTPQKLCFILQVSDYYLYLDDLSHGKMLNDPGYYTLKEPSVTLHGFKFLCFCKVGNMLYMFEGAYAGQDAGKIGGCVYLYPLVNHLNLNLSEDDLDIVLTKNEVQRSFMMLGPKVEPAAIKYNDREIIVFSTDINFLNCDACDFELYNVGGGSSRPLPCLCVWYSYCSESGVARYSLMGDATIDARSVKEDARDRIWGFSISAYSLVHGHLLVVQTDFGLLFSLDLVQAAEWKFWDGSILPAPHQNLMTENGLVLCPSGASVYASPGVTVPFPLLSHSWPGYYKQNSIISLEQLEFPHYQLGILQVSNYSYERAISTVDLVNVNASNFKSDGNQDKEKEEKFAEHIKCFKFDTIVWGGSATPKALFLF